MSEVVLRIVMHVNSQSLSLSCFIPYCQHALQYTKQLWWKSLATVSPVIGPQVDAGRHFTVAMADADLTLRDVFKKYTYIVQRYYWRLRLYGVQHSMLQFHDKSRPFLERLTLLQQFILSAWYPPCTMVLPADAKSVFRDAVLVIWIMLMVAQDPMLPFPYVDIEVIYMSMGLPPELRPFNVTRATDVVNLACTAGQIFGTDLTQIDAPIAYFLQFIDAYPTSELVPLVHHFILIRIFSKFNATADLEALNQLITHGRAALRGPLRENINCCSVVIIALERRAWQCRLQDDLVEGAHILRSLIAFWKRRGTSPEFIKTMQCRLIQLICSPLFPRTIPQLDESIGILTELVAAWPSDRMMQIALHDKLLDKAKATSNHSLIEEISAKMQKLLNGHTELTSEERNQIMLLLGGLHTERGIDCASRSSLSDLEAGIAYYKRIDDTTVTLPLTWLLAFSYGIRLRTRWNTEDVDTLRNLIAQTSMTTQLGEIAYDTSDFVSACAALMLHMSGSPSLALPYYIRALTLFPQHRLLARDYKPGNSSQRLSYQWNYLALDAVGAAIACGNYDTALELFELGRSTAWGKISLMREELDPQFIEQYPEYADQVAKVRASWETSDLSQLSIRQPILQQNSELSSLSSEDHLAMHFPVMQQWDKLVNDIRKLSGHEDFMLPPTYEQLKYVASEGPVIIIIPNNYRADALLITSSAIDRPTLVPLCSTSSLTALTRIWCFNFLSGCQKVDAQLMDHKQFNNVVFRPLLRGLWEEVLRPIRLVLRTLEPYARRVWICATGHLALLPVHAAINGLREDVEDGFLELVPSYAVTLTSLLRAREQGSSSLTSRDSNSMNLLAVSCKGAEGFNDIRGASKEIKQIVKVLSKTSESVLNPQIPKPKATILQNRLATGGTVLTSMSTHSWIHLACHGIQDTADPFQSHFILQDGPLYLADIIRSTGNNKEVQSKATRTPMELAFLSACHTATGVVELSEESLHLAGGMHCAGYRSVVGTMWSVHDDTARKLAVEVYRRLFDLNTQASCPDRDVQVAPRAEDVAEALYSSVQKLRRHGVPWSRLAPFVHIGV